MPSAAELFATASREYAARRLQRAEQTARQVLALEPRHAAAWHLLGSIAYETGRPAAAVECFREAAEADPSCALYPSSLGAAYQALGRYAEAAACHEKALQPRPGDPLVLNNLAITLVSLGKKAEAIAAFRQVLETNPRDADALNNLGAALMAEGKPAEALSCYDRALALRPGFAQAHNNRGNALHALGRSEEALAAYEQAIRASPQFAQAHKNLGDVLYRTGKLDAAVRAYQQALQIKPDDAEAHAGLGTVLLGKNATAQAQACYERALQLRPADADFLNGLGNAFHSQGRLAESEDAYRRACALRPEDPTPRYNLGVTLQAQGRLAEAQDCYREALRLRPHDPVAHSTYLGSLNYDPTVEPAALLAEHRRWAEVHAPGWGQGSCHENTPDPGRRLRVGYVSPDLRSHAVAFFLEPILYHHDRGAIEVHAYSDVAAADWETAYLRTLAEHWRDVYGLADDRLERLIRQDRIDILVDLTGHTAGNRLLVFARKPAPVQVSYLGYPATTGLSQMDYRLTDPVCDPPGEPTRHTEELVRLEPLFCTYAPPRNAGRPQAPPVTRAGAVTFGSLHKLDKLNPAVIASWSRILAAVPGSRLLVGRNTIQAQAAERLQQRFAEHGIAPDRVVLRRIEPVRMQHLRLYEEMDISLDPFPWNGHTTACEALWMGVPVVALRGDRHSSRMVASVLSGVGLGELAAADPAEYHRLAVGLSGDRARLGELRRSLRGRLLDSPLCDGAAFTRGLEAAYRRMWRRWCERPGA